MTKKLILWDRSRGVLDWVCPRKRYWGYEFEGRGIAPHSLQLELYLGIVLHDSLAAIAHSHQSNEGKVDIDLIASTAQKEVLTGLLKETTGEIGEVNFVHEQAALIEGLLRGFYRHVWPRLMQAYPRIVCIEEEMVYDHDGLTFMSRPDLILEDADGSWVYVEYKSTSSKKEGWINSWATAVQLHSTIKAVEQTLGKAPSTVLVQGLYKGFESYGKQSSPFCYAYAKPAHPPFSEAVVRYDYAPGLKRTPVWDFEGGVKEWVEGMSDEFLGEQFPQAPPIFVNDALVERFFAQRASREHEIRISRELMEFVEEGEKGKIMDATFPQRFDQCRPTWGRSCQYLRLCHSHVEDPLSSGFQWRTSHHDLETQQHQKEDEENDSQE